MIKELVHDPIFLTLKSEPATAADLQTAQDLLETLTAHKEVCVGMAANMIGVNKSIICFDNDGKYMIMLNPEIIKRYKKIRVQYQTLDFKIRTKTFEGWTAQIVQHEIDHCNGVLI